MFPIMITRSPLSPHFNPYSKYILEVFPGISVYCYSLLQFVFQLLSQQITHDICFCIIRCSKRNLDICHYILSLNLKLYICPNLGERSKIYKVSYDTINGFLAPSSSSLYDQNNAPYERNYSIFTRNCQIRQIILTYNNI